MSLASIENSRLHRYLSELERPAYCCQCGELITDDQISVEHRHELYHDACAIEAGVITEEEIKQIREGEME